MKKEYNLDKLKPRKKPISIDDSAIKTPVSIRIYGSMITWYKKEAKRLGIPYQTLMGSVMHRFANGDLVDKEDIKKFA